MKKRLKFQRFTKQYIHEDLYWYYAIDFYNVCAIMVRNGCFGFGKVLESEIQMTCIENAIKQGTIEITKNEFVKEYKRALKSLQNVTIVTK